MGGYFSIPVDINTTRMFKFVRSVLPVRSRGLSTVVGSPSSIVATPGEPIRKDYTWVKQKSRFKRAGHLIAQLGLELAVEFEKKNLVPHFRPGDALQVTYTRSTQTESPSVIAGVVIAMKNRSINSSFKLLCVVDKTPLELTFPLYSPNVKEIRVVKHNYVTSKRKRVRRAKLYYLKERPQSLYTVSDNDIALMESRVKREALALKKEEKRLKKIEKLERGLDKKEDESK